MDLSVGGQKAQPGRDSIGVPPHSAHPTLSQNKPLLVGRRKSEALKARGHMEGTGREEDKAGSHFPHSLTDTSYQTVNSPHFWRV